jgi:hypothetical protein
VNYTTNGDTVTVSELEFHSTAPIIFDAGAGSTNLTDGSGTFNGTPITTSGSGVAVTYITATNFGFISGSIGGTTSVMFQDPHVNGYGYALGLSPGTIYFSGSIIDPDNTLNNSIIALK